MKATDRSVHSPTVESTMPVSWTLFFALLIGLLIYTGLYSYGSIQTADGDGVTIVHTGVSNE